MEDKNLVHRLGQLEQVDWFKLLQCDAIRSEQFLRRCRREHCIFVWRQHWEPNIWRANIFWSLSWRFWISKVPRQIACLKLYTLQQRTHNASLMLLCIFVLSYKKYQYQHNNFLYMWSKMLSASLYAVLTLSVKKSSKELFPSYCITLCLGSVTV